MCMCVCVCVLCVSCVFCACHVCLYGMCVDACVCMHVCLCVHACMFVCPCMYVCVSMCTYEQVVQKVDEDKFVLERKETTGNSISRGNSILMKW